MDQLIIPALMHAGQYLVTLTLTALALFSVYSLSVIGERWWTFRQARTASDGLLASVLDEVGRGRLQEALTACKVGRGSYLAAVLAAGLREVLPLESANPGLHAGPDMDRATFAAREAMQRTTAAEIERLEQRLTSLATLGNISPFVGLFGTVIGIMRAFDAISRTGTGALASVSTGIAEALVATAAGLFVAIPAVIAYNHFVSRVKSAATEMDGAASELVATVHRTAQR
ncbi:MAG TPA: MotA/TolQ/ExbB proton channel family protein [Candidatus Methylomirabilis sp.]